MKKHLFNLINQLESIIYEPLYDQKYVNNNKAWDYVCYSFESFLLHIKEAHRIFGKDKSKKFIDVGCGLGTKVSLANLYFDSYGIELSKSYYDVAVKVNQEKTFHKYGRYVITPNQKEKIFNEDALKFDYKPYDVIYFFRPINKVKMQKKLENHIFNTAKGGAIIIPIYAQSEFPKFIHKLETPSKELFMKAKCKNRIAKVQEHVKSLFSFAAENSYGATGR